MVLPNDHVQIIHPNGDHRYNYRTSVGMTKAMQAKLEQVVENRKDPKFTQADAIREAIRFYLDQQEDLIGSRKHFSRSLERNLKNNEEKILFILYAMLFLIARMFSFLVHHFAKTKVEPPALIESAMIDSKKEYMRLNTFINKIRASTVSNNNASEMETP